MDPHRPGAFPSINSAVGTYTINAETHSLDWLIDSVEFDDDTKSGAMEFNVAGDDVAAFFPIAVDFVSQRGLCGVEVNFNAWSAWKCELMSIDYIGIDSQGG